MASKRALRQRALEILLRLKRHYPNSTCALHYQTPLQLLVATILSAQCTDERVNQVTPELFRRFPDAQALATAPREEIEALIHSTGFYRNKAKHIQEACRKILSDFGGQVPRTMPELLTLPGVARKTANVVLAHAFGIHAGVIVDTYVKCFSRRLGLTEHEDLVRVEKDLMQLLPQADWENWSIRLIDHGRAICTARRPLCQQCFLVDLCPSAPLLRPAAPDEKMDKKATKASPT